MDSPRRDIFYSRRNFVKPDEQKPPHQCFEDEVEYLDCIFKADFKSGIAYSLGRVNGDMWYMYTLDNAHSPINTPDQTLEVLMTDLDPLCMQKFTKKVCPTTEQMLKESQIEQLIPGAKLDVKSFDPCGFSVNAIIKEEIYYTIHVTPQASCSYVSFETNIEKKSYFDLISKVVSLFRPSRCTVTLFANKNAQCGHSYSVLSEQPVDGYKTSCRQFCEFQMYNLALSCLEKT
ncbi:S-adenosylmethionine decarboxylase proenzyme-like isoform X2 [Dysidea avara]|uniref:S-adenosylmethionine decarboxylase proenzyme-like isoform X2 n=1 Tax=Dysidea avara TaxID=196820 RepID=UPI0033168D26